jgi:hypothetical protein
MRKGLWVCEHTGDDGESVLVTGPPLEPPPFQGRTIPSRAHTDNAPSYSLWTGF